jgi:hypothetical protein
MSKFPLIYVTDMTDYHRRESGGKTIATSDAAPAFDAYHRAAPNCAVSD